MKCKSATGTFNLPSSFFYISTVIFLLIRCMGISKSRTVLAAKIFLYTVIICMANIFSQIHGLTFALNNKLDLFFVTF